MNEPFVPYKLEEEREKAKEKGETFTIWISAEERKWLDKYKRLIRQPKDSTAIKQLAKVGAYLIGSQSTAYLIDTLFKNERKNKRQGIQEIE